MEGMGALVVSRETTSGADWINSHRKSAGFRPIAVVVVGLIGADGQTAESTKLSSSALREARASREEPQK
jgi:phosphopantetheine adenylyltransferase